MSSAYNGYGNEGISWSNWYQPFVDVATHPIDSLRAFIGAPIALLGGALATTGEAVSGIATPLITDLPAQQTIAEIVSAPSAGTAESIAPVTPSSSAFVVPTWMKVTIAAVLLLSAYELTKGKA